MYYFPLDQSNAAPVLSFVIPVFNEEGSLRKLDQALRAELEDLGLSYEIVFVNDGSHDDTAAILDELSENDERINVIHFRRNFGKAAGLDAGFQSARGRVVITMDADLQDDPAEIRSMLEKLDEGYDLVSGWKTVRHDPLDKTLPSKVFNWVVSRVSGLKLHDFNCGFKAYRREALANIRLYGELHRFVPVLVHWNGFRVAEKTVQHHPRQFGKSKFGAERFLKGLFDLMTVTLTTKFRGRPLHFFGYPAIAIGCLGAIGLVYLFTLSILGLDDLRPRPMLYAAMVAILTSVQLLGIGLLGELIKSFNRSEHTDYTIAPSRTVFAPAILDKTNTPASEPPLDNKDARRTFTR